MAQVVIDNPVINSPFAEPERHFRFTDEGISNQIDAGRRQSEYFVPIAAPKKKGKQRYFDTEWTKDRIEPNRLVNQIRPRIKQWREGGYVGVTPTTGRLLAYWTDPARDKRLFFCQIEALETAIYVAEVAKKYGDAWIDNDLRDANDMSNPGLPRTAFKMATGAGKTVVMAMLIAWQALNKLANPQDARFSDTFLIVTPGITIRDRLRVLLPNDPQNYYRQRDIISAELLERLQRAKIVIKDFHTFLLREESDAAKLTKLVAGQLHTGVNKESPERMVRRACRELGNKKNIIVINDEAHHCYRRKPDGDDVKLTGDERKEAEKRNADARVWISGIEAFKAKIGVKAIYDLSATPFFLRGSGWPEGTLFQWVVSDFSLIDAIEAGIVKVPRVPVSDDSMTGDQPTYRDIWLRIRDELPKKGRGTEAVGDEPKLPRELEGALRSLYGNYEKYYRLWESNPVARTNTTPPVFIVVCNNTNVSKLVFDYIAGWEKQVRGQTVVQAGALAIFRNDDGHGGWLQRPNSILVDSEQLESGEAMSDEFKKLAAREIDEFKAEYRMRFPGADTEKLTDEDLLREVMNTVGKPGKLGEHVKCVVSVSMLTEGWDANTVTHVLGVRAFGTQLLCEQVVGRALRRMSYAPEPQSVRAQGRTHEFIGFPAEYAEVYGVPFSFLPCGGSANDPKPQPIPTRVRALEERIACEITFPRLAGYRFDIGTERLSARFDEGSRLALSTQDVPTRTEVDPIVGQRSVHRLDDLRNERENTVAFVIARRTLERYFRDGDGNDKPWLFPQLLAISKRWLAECVTLKDNAFLQMLLLHELTHDAADRVYRAIPPASGGAATLKPILRPYDTLGTTRHVDFDTTRPTYSTRADKCHVSHVVADTESWEQKLAQTLENMPQVLRYVKNQNLGFTIPYVLDGQERQYHPDFIAVLDDGHGSANPLQLIIEVTGEHKKDKAAKVSTARTLWAPAVNSHGGFGRWAFVEIADPWDAEKLIGAALGAAVDRQEHSR
ncbi:Type III restriction enzyme, res subunit [Phycisphaerae bacterium RAS1]|nr:Type III restriction enzyme, res subunit [Phycisphaerae bacterium RAS1]